MFFEYGEERINIDLIKSYNPEEKRGYYNIILKFIDNSERVLHFFKRKDKRDEFLSFLDQNLLSFKE